MPPTPAKPVQLRRPPPCAALRCRYYASTVPTSLREPLGRQSGGGPALTVCGSGFLPAHLKRLVDLAGQSRLAAIYEHGDFPSAGGLMSYGPSIAEMYRQ